MKTEPTEALKEIKHCTWTAEDFNINDGLESYEVIDGVDAINIANTAFKEGQSSPKIKRLEWKRDCDGIWFTKRVSFEFGAMIQETKKGMFRLSYKWDTYFTPYDSLDKAKAAAQADFEKRVMECLDLKAQQKQAIIDMMMGDEELGLYDCGNEQ